jgi:hypothetical protein
MNVMTFAATKEESPLTLKEALEKLRKAAESIPPEPFAEFMRKRGRDPKDGWVFVLPLAAWRPSFGSALPDYVMFHPHVETPLFIKKPDYFGIESFV